MDNNNITDFLQKNYPFKSVLLYSDSGFLKYQFQLLEGCSTIKKYIDLGSSIENLLTNSPKLSNGEDNCNLVIKIILPDYTSTFAFYRNKIKKLELNYTVFADGEFTEKMKELIDLIPN